MTYYLREISRMPLQIWKIEENCAVCLGVTNPQGGGGTYFKALDGEDIWTAMRRQATGWFLPDGYNPFHRCVLCPGEFYPRMARPDNASRDESPGSNPNAHHENSFIAGARGQLKSLTRMLDRICQTVHPTEKMLGTFGHEIRNLLILACTEAETHWRGVLAANGIKKERYTTNDYSLLCDAMKLHEYEVHFPHFPWLRPIRPFEGWIATQKPSQDLKWYEAYNAVKHDREMKFEEATLGNAFAALSACAVMLVAQFGRPSLDQELELVTFFDFCSVPVWPLSQIYLQPCEAGSAWKPLPYFGKGAATRAG